MFIILENKKFHDCNSFDLVLSRTGLRFPGLNLETVWWGITDTSEEGDWRVAHSGEVVQGHNWMEGHPKTDTLSNCGMSSAQFGGARQGGKLLDIKKRILGEQGVPLEDTAFVRSFVCSRVLKFKCV